MLSSAPAAGRTEGDQCSWKLDSSTASTRCPASSASTTGSPTLPQATASSPALRRMDSSMLTVVVLPLVPVTASQVGGCSHSRLIRQASSTSLITSIPAATAAASSGLSARQPGLVTTRSVPSGGSVNPATSSAPALPTEASAASRCSAASVTVTTAPWPSRASAAERPVTPAPATSTLRPARPVVGTDVGRFMGSAPHGAQPVAVEQPEAEHAADPAEQPETDDHRGLRPAGQLEVVVERRHPEQPAAGGPEHGDLQHHRKRLHDEQPADDHQQQLGAGGHGQSGDQAAERERPGVPHEDLGGGGVPPQEAHAAGHRRGGDHGQVQRVAHLVAAGGGELAAV